MSCTMSMLPSDDLETDGSHEFMTNHGGELDDSRDFRKDRFVKGSKTCNDLNQVRRKKTPTKQTSSSCSVVKSKHEKKLKKTTTTKPNGYVRGEVKIDNNPHHDGYDRDTAGFGVNNNTIKPMAISSSPSADTYVPVVVTVSSICIVKDDEDPYRNGKADSVIHVKMNEKQVVAAEMKTDVTKILAQDLRESDSTGDGVKKSEKITDFKERDEEEKENGEEAEKKADSEVVKLKSGSNAENKNSTTLIRLEEVKGVTNKMATVVIVTDIKEKQDWSSKESKKREPVEDDEDDVAYRNCQTNIGSDEDRSDKSSITIAASVATVKTEDKTECKVYTDDNSANELPSLLEDLKLTEDNSMKKLGDEFGLMRLQEESRKRLLKTMKKDVKCMIGSMLAARGITDSPHAYQQQTYTNSPYQQTQQQQQQSPYGYSPDPTSPYQHQNHSPQQDTGFIGSPNHYNQSPPHLITAMSSPVQYAQSPYSQYSHSSDGSPAPSQQYAPSQYTELHSPANGVQGDPTNHFQYNNDQFCEIATLLPELGIDAVNNVLDLGPDAMYDDGVPREPKRQCVNKLPQQNDHRSRNITGSDRSAVVVETPPPNTINAINFTMESHDDGHRGISPSSGHTTQHGQNGHCTISGSMQMTTPSSQNGHGSGPSFGPMTTQSDQNGHITIASSIDQSFAIQSRQNGHVGGASHSLGQMTTPSSQNGHMGGASPSLLQITTQPITQSMVTNGSQPNLVTVSLGSPLSVASSPASGLVSPAPSSISATNSDAPVMSPVSSISSYAGSPSSRSVSQSPEMDTRYEPDRLHGNHLDTNLVPTVHPDPPVRIYNGMQHIMYNGHWYAQLSSGPMPPSQPGPVPHSQPGLLVPGQQVSNIQCAVDSNYQYTTSVEDQWYRMIAATSLNKLTCHDEDGDTVLHIAIAQRDIALCKAVIFRLERESRASLDAQDNHGQTPLFLAVLTKLLPIIDCLITVGASTTKTTHDGRTIFHCAAELGFVDAVQTIYEAIFRYNSSNPSVRFTPEMDVKNNEGLSALHVAVVSHCTDKRVFLGENATDIRVDSSKMIELLINMNASADCQDGKSGKTALHFAAERGMNKLMEILFFTSEHGADLANCQMYNGNTALHLVVGSNRSEAEILKLMNLLYKNGADPGIENAEKEKPAACSNKKHKKVNKKLKSGQ